MHDLVIRSGLVVDGTGDTPRRTDIAITDGCIAAVGDDLGPSRETIDAGGLLVTPGFVDVHTHLDGQVIWDSVLAPLVWHGVTTAIVGNCGVGFAPARPKDYDYLIDLMAAVEDIPAESLQAGLSWDWESFPDYMEAVDRGRRTLDIAAMITHGAVRRYVMGARANEKPTAEELAQMCAIVRQAVAAGAVGLSTSRTMLHTSSDGAPLPGTYADEDELVALACAVREAGGDRGVLEVSPAGTTVPEPTSLLEDVEMLIRIARASGCRVIFSMLQSNFEPAAYTTILARVEQAHAQGVPIHPEVGSRPVATLLGLQGHFNPFSSLPAYAEIASLRSADRIARLAEPAMRARILDEWRAGSADSGLGWIHPVFASTGFWNDVFPMGVPLNYYPGAGESIRSLADQVGGDPAAIAYDAMMADEGKGFLIFTVVNWADRNRDALRSMIHHPGSIMGLGDAGAHVMAVADASGPTTFLAGWVRDADPGQGYHLSIERAVQKLTSEPAEMFGLRDRGAIRPGLRADLNLIDLAALHAETPELVNDLPLGHSRLDQKARGYVATLVAGIVTQRNGVLTGDHPGRFARGS